MKLELPANVPPWAWITGAVALAILVALGFGFLAIAARQRRARQAAAGATNQANDPAAKRKERRGQRLVSAAAAICIVLYLGLFASGFQAIAGFARSFLHRSGLLVPATPLTLDGVVIGALFLSLAFVAKQKSPAKANALIWGMTIFSAYCGFTYGEHGKDGSLAAGLYFASMSIVGMFMFHMVLDLLQDSDGDYVKSKYPAMGWRWLTHWSTLPVMLAWINHPPRRQNAEAKERPTVREAIDHWRHLKTIRVRADAIRAAEQHERKLAQARRQAELAQARRAAELASATPLPAPAPAAHLYAGHAQLPTFTQPHHSRPQVVPLDTATAARTVTAPVNGGDDEQPSASIKVPAGVDTCATWMEQWVKLVADHPQFADGSRGISLADAQKSAGCSDRQARFVREAARAGLLRAKAEELGVPVPAGYRDRPEDNRVNGARLTAVAS